MLLVTASNQLTINPKDGINPSLGSQPESIIAFQYLRLTSVATFGQLPSGSTGKAQVLEGDDGLGSGSQRRLFSSLRVDC